MRDVYRRRGLHALPLAILAATRCQLNNDSISLSQDNRVATTDDSIGVGSGGAGAKDAGQSATAPFGTATTAKDEAIVQGGLLTKNVVGLNVDTSGTLNAGGFAQGGQGNKIENSTLTVGYSASDLQGALQTVGSNVSQAVQAAQANSQQTLDAVFTRLADLSESKQTDGDSSRNKIILWVIGGVLALLAYLYSK